ncbi:plasmid mobilization relaxosome protein MobC [Providencia stuartii]|uniref:plasmid mobilization relaxosome protein MobC n=1 Tax=Providencia TaxID=586 RepID=UPI0030029CC2
MREKRKLKNDKVKTYKDKYKRKNMISLCLDDDEYLKIKKIADELNVPRATAVRKILISNANVLLSEIKKNDNKDLVLELNKIGNNLNQITKKINSNIEYFLMGDAETLALSIDELNENFNKALKEIL